MSRTSELATARKEIERLRRVYSSFEDNVREALHGPSWRFGRTNDQHIADIKKLRAELEQTRKQLRDLDDYIEGCLV